MPRVVGPDISIVVDLLKGRRLNRDAFDIIVCPFPEEGPVVYNARMKATKRGPKGIIQNALTVNWIHSPNLSEVTLWEDGDVTFVDTFNNFWIITPKHYRRVRELLDVWFTLPKDMLWDFDKENEPFAVETREIRERERKERRK